MSNVVALWLELIDSPDRALRLLAAYNGPTAWRGCPSAALYSQEESYRLYANPRFRPALDAWDTGLVTRRDILCWAKYRAAQGSKIVTESVAA